MINEFFTTEISHVKNLNALLDLFYTPLKNNEIISKVDARIYSISLEIDQSVCQFSLQCTKMYAFIGFKYWSIGPPAKSINYQTNNKYIITKNIFKIDKNEIIF